MEARPITAAAALLRAGGAAPTPPSTAEATRRGPWPLGCPHGIGARRHIPDLTPTTSHAEDVNVEDVIAVFLTALALESGNSNFLEPEMEIGFCTADAQKDLAADPSLAAGELTHQDDNNLAKETIQHVCTLKLADDSALPAACKKGKGLHPNDLLKDAHEAGEDVPLMPTHSLVEADPAMVDDDGEVTIEAFLATLKRALSAAALTPEICCYLPTTALVEADPFVVDEDEDAAADNAAFAKTIDEEKEEKTHASCLPLASLMMGAVLIREVAPLKPTLRLLSNPPSTRWMPTMQSWSRKKKVSDSSLQIMREHPLAHHNPNLVHPSKGTVSAPTDEKVMASFSADNTIPTPDIPIHDAVSTSAEGFSLDESSAIFGIWDEDEGPSNNSHSSPLTDATSLDLANVPSAAQPLLMTGHHVKVQDEREVEEEVAAADTSPMRLVDLPVPTACLSVIVIDEKATDDEDAPAISPDESALFDAAVPHFGPAIKEVNTEAHFPGLLVDDSAVEDDAQAVISNQAMCDDLTFVAHDAVLTVSIEAFSPKLPHLWVPEDDEADMALYVYVAVLNYVSSLLSKSHVVSPMAFLPPSFGRRGGVGTDRPQHTQSNCKLENSDVADSRARIKLKNVCSCSIFAFNMHQFLIDPG